MKVNSKYPVIAWWSGGVASAVTCKICIDWFGVENVRVVFIDTHNEHPDTYRFLNDCEKWYECKIETIDNLKYGNIQDVWFDSLSLNIAKGAKCSQVLKKDVRQQFIKKNNFSYQAFGFDISERNRAKDMKTSNPHLNPIFPLIAELLNKKDCIKRIVKANSLFLSIEIPVTYKMGFNNNNCFQTGCVQGGIGYWQKMRDDHPTKFDAMADMEHQLTDLKGKPVTMLKDQSNDAKDTGDVLVFLKPHPKYPNLKDISMMEGRPIEPLADCNGFCQTK